MTSHEFNQILSNRIDLIKSVLQAKADHYADDNDRLHNFKAAASLRNTNPIDALNGMMAKHIISIQDMLNKFNGVKEIEVTEIPAHTWVNEKITDAINYLILVEAIFEEYRINDNEYQLDDVDRHLLNLPKSK